MTVDLDTLLHDAGREPTIDIDVKGVHVRGRRRTLVRRTAVGVAALATFGVVATGLASLPADQPTVGPIDQGPTEADGRVARTVEQLPRVSEAELAAELGVTVLRVEPVTGLVSELDEPIRVTATTPDGQVVTDPWAPGDVGPGPFGVATADGTVWGVDPDGDLVGRNPLTGGERRVTGSGHPWVPRGTTSEGELLAATSSQATDEEGTPLQVGIVRSGTEVVEPVAGVDAAAVVGPGTLLAAAATSEALVLASIEHTNDATVTPTRIHLLPTGGEPVLLYETDVNGRLVIDVEVVGDEVWALEFVDADSIVRRFSLAGEDLGEVQQERGTTLGVMADLSASPDGSTVVLSMAPGERPPGEAVVLDVGAIRAGVSLHDAARLLDVPGTIQLLPAPEAASVAARCATGPYAQELDTQVVDAVWFPCQGSGGEDRLVSYFPVERLSGVDFATEEARLEAYLGALFEGPTEAEQALGLDPVVSPDVATLTGVAVDGATVTVDLAAGEQVGVLGTSYAGAVFETAVAAAVLQFIGYEQVTLTLDGSCQAWAALRAIDGCPTYEEGVAPWAQVPPAAVDELGPSEEPADE